MSSVPGPLAPPSPIALFCSHSQNYCVLAKLRDFVASPQCWKVAEVDTLKDKVRKLYTIMNSFCRRVSEALEEPFSVMSIAGVGLEGGLREGLPVQAAFLQQ